MKTVCAGRDSRDVSDIVPGDDIFSGKYPVLTYSSDLIYLALQAGNKPIFNKSEVFNSFIPNVEFS